MSRVSCTLDRPQLMPGARPGQTTAEGKGQAMVPRQILGTASRRFVFCETPVTVPSLTSGSAAASSQTAVLRCALGLASLHAGDRTANQREASASCRPIKSVSGRDDRIVRQDVKDTSRRVCSARRLQSFQFQFAKTATTALWAELLVQ